MPTYHKEREMSLHPLLAELITRYPQLSSCETSLQAALEMLKSTFSHGRKVLLCGNGGSNADCEHIVAELMKSFRHPRPIPESLQQDLLSQNSIYRKALAAKLQGGLPAISLGAHAAINTAVANDTCAEMAFAQQLYALSQPGDLLWCISTSGNSVNILHAATLANILGVQTLALTGKDGGKLREICNETICVPATEIHLVQELHLPVYHALCAAVEEIIFGN